MSKEEKLIKTLEEYIEFLGKDYEIVFMIAYSRGHRSKPEDIQKGEELREKIRKLKSEL